MTDERRATPRVDVETFVKDFFRESEPDAGSGTRMTLRNRGEPAGFSRIVAPLLAGAMRRANSKDLARLKTLLEGGAAPVRPH